MLYLKIFLWQVEPIQGNGGVMALIPKSGGARASGYRGIMLLGTLCKRLHAVLRARLIPKLLEVKPPGQLGGFPAQQSIYGAQAIQTFGRITQQANLPTAVLFVDLSNAFHRLVRQLVVGRSREEDAMAVLQALQAQEQPTAGLTVWMKLPGLLERLNFSPILVQLLRDIHVNTWFTLPKSNLLSTTRRGTRPGSPLADVIFHILMVDITHELNTWLESRTSSHSILRSINCSIDSIVWSDDVAIPLCAHTHTCEELLDNLRQLLPAVHCIFARRGFELNMAKGKAAAVVSFRGQGAPSYRRRYQLSAQPGMEFPSETGATMWLHFVPQYRHLGTMYAADNSVNPEIQRRIGQAAGAFAVLAKPALCNRKLPLKVRLNLYRALVCTFYGLGGWPTLSLKRTDALLHFIGRQLRRILHHRYQEGDCNLTGAQILAKAGFHHPRARHAIDRSTSLCAEAIFLRATFSSWAPTTGTLHAPR